MVVVLAVTRCSLLFKRHVSPDRELHAYIADIA